ncbi:condensation domain-containing protein, partial [Tsukamurella soli]
PATRTEIAVARLYGELLAAGAVAAGDSFFGLGGHSLLATRLVALLRRDLGVTVPVAAVFDAPTVAELAAAVDRALDRAAEGGAPDDVLPPVRTVSDRPARIPLTASQRSIWFAHIMSGASAGSEGASGAGVIEVALRLDGPVDAHALEAALGDVVARHEALRTVFEVDGGVPVGTVLAARARDLVLDRVTADDPQAARAQRMRRPFELIGGELLRAALISGSSGTVLQLLVHHLVIDHASFATVIDDLFAAYRARVAGMPPADVPAAQQFPDYALWQAEVFSSAAGRREVEQTVAVLRGAPDEIPARHDHPRRLSHAFAAGHRVTFTVPADVRARLKSLADRSGATEFMIGQAAAAVLLHRHAGGEDLVVGTPAAGRTDPATESMVGLLANMIALRTPVTADAGLADVLRAARASALDALRHQAAPFEAVVDALAPQRRPGRNPVFQTMVHVRDDSAAAAPRAVTDRLTAAPLPTDFDVALIDLSLSLFANADGGWDGMVIASPTVYAAETAAVLADGLQAVLAAMAADADVTVGSLDLPGLAGGAGVGEDETGGAATGSTGSPETVAKLIDILEELLGVAGVEPGDNFFAVGGDSVTSLQWSARAAADGLALTPQMVFETATIDELAAAVDAAGGSSVADGETPLAAPEPAPPSAPMSASGLGPDQLAALQTAWKGNA